MKYTLIAGTFILAALVAFMPAQASDSPDGAAAKKGRGKLQARVVQLEKEVLDLHFKVGQILPVVNRLEIEVKELQAKK